MSKKLILSGIQPTGVPHVGNYFGAISKWIQEAQEESSPKSETRILTSVVDLHALTMPQTPGNLRKNTVEMGMALMAAGLDPEKAILFRQSKVHQHAELAWILFCKTPVSWLAKMHQWKVLIVALRKYLYLIKCRQNLELLLQLLLIPYTGILDSCLIQFSKLQIYFFTSTFIAFAQHFCTQILVQLMFLWEKINLNTLI